MKGDKMNVKEKLTKIFQNETLDGRTVAAIKRRGFVQSDGSLTMRGLHEIGEYKHVPQIPYVDIEKCIGKIIQINENITVGCECCGSQYTETFNISAEKLAKEYNQYVEWMNKKLHELWGETLDYDYDRGLTNKSIKSILINALKREHYSDKPDFDRRYIQHILNSAMEQMNNGNTKGYTSSSYKYSITDTTGEIKDLTCDDGEIIFTHEVEINR